MARDNLAYVDSSEALQSVENALRLIIRDILGDGWLELVDDTGKLEGKRTEDKKRRDGAIVPDDLLAYVEFPQLVKVILRKWDPHFFPVFQDKKRTEIWLEALQGVRNAIAHSRQLVQFEKDLTSGISGQLRNLVTIYRTEKNPASAHYSVIDSVRDSLGRDGALTTMTYMELKVVRPRLEVGEEVTFTCQGSDSRGREIEWFIVPRRESNLGPPPDVYPIKGEAVVLNWKPSEEDIAEELLVVIHMRSVDGKFRRFMPSSAWEDHPYDDVRVFPFVVNPPPD